MPNRGSKSGPLAGLREKYAILYHRASPGTVERSAYYQLYIILLNSISSSKAASKIRALGESVPEGYRHLCDSALGELTHEDKV